MTAKELVPIPTTSHILVVEDDDGLAALLEALLEDAGYAVAIAHSGPEAIRWVSQQEPLLIFLDIRMPGMDGIETFREIYRRVPQCRVVFMTGYSEPLIRCRPGGSIEQLPSDTDAAERRILDAVGCEAALVVAQDAAFARRLKTMCTERGHEPQLAADPFEAVFRFEGRAGQVVILEPRLKDLPPMSLRDLNPGNVRLLLSRGIETSPGVIRPALFLPKPFRPEDLLQAVAMALEQAHA